MRARGVVSGVVCGVGAVVAHLLAGGAATIGSASAVMLLSLPLGLLLTRDVKKCRLGEDVPARGRGADSAGLRLDSARLDSARLGALALLTQVGWHGLLMLRAPGALAGENTVRMLAAHLVVAALTVLVVVRADHALAEVLGALWTRLFARPEAGAIVLVRRTPRAMPVVVRAESRRVASSWTRRGPPSCSAD